MRRQRPPSRAERGQRLSNAARGAMSSVGVDHRTSTRLFASRQADQTRPWRAEEAGAGSSIGCRARRGDGSSLRANRQERERLSRRRRGDGSSPAARARRGRVACSSASSSSSWRELAPEVTAADAKESLRRRAVVDGDSTSRRVPEVPSTPINVAFPEVARSRTRRGSAEVVSIFEGPHLTRHASCRPERRSPRRGNRRRSTSSPSRTRSKISGDGDASVCLLS